MHESFPYKPGDGFYYYEQYSVVDKHKYKWNDETQQYDFGGAGVKLKKVYVYVDNTTDAKFNKFLQTFGLLTSSVGEYG
ncbi:MAG: hypothetical protein KGZ81_03515 [Flavobacteriales bacterium]|nr:hypothetical protein [Flavobacteriales bacterium]